MEKTLSTFTVTVVNGTCTRHVIIPINQSIVCHCLVRNSIGLQHNFSLFVIASPALHGRDCENGKNNAICVATLSLLGQLLSFLAERKYDVKVIWWGYFSWIR